LDYKKIVSSPPCGQRRGPAAQISRFQLERSVMFPDPDRIDPRRNAAAIRPTQKRFRSAMKEIP
jgi:hypothetical protein